MRLSVGAHHTPVALCYPSLALRVLGQKIRLSLPQVSYPLVLRKSVHCLPPLRTGFRVWIHILRRPSQEIFCLLLSLLLLLHPHPLNSSGMFHSTWTLVLDTNCVHCQILRGRHPPAAPIDWLVDERLFDAAPAPPAGSARSPPEDADQPPAKRRRSSLLHDDSRARAPGI